VQLQRLQRGEHDEVRDRRAVFLLEFIFPREEARDDDAARDVEVRDDVLGAVTRRACVFSRYEASTTSASSRSRQSPEVPRRATA